MRATTATQHRHQRSPKSSRASTDQGVQIKAYAFEYEISRELQLKRQRRPTKPRHPASSRRRQYLGRSLACTTSLGGNGCWKYAETHTVSHRRAFQRWSGQREHKGTTAKKKGTKRIIKKNGQCAKQDQRKTHEKMSGRGTQATPTAMETKTQCKISAIREGL